MFVKTGWNTDFGKQKFDIGMDETDLARILTEAGISPDAQLTSRETFQILRMEAERFSTVQRAQVVPAEAEGCRLEVKRLTGQLAAQLDSVRTRLGHDVRSGVA